MNKRALVEKLLSQLRASFEVARRAGEEAAEAAISGATPAERRDDARVFQEYSRMARAQSARAAQAAEELSLLETFHPKRLARNAKVELGAVVEVEDEDEGRTFFLAPVGAGVELTGEGGDGFLSVITPRSPLGRAVLGRRVGDTIEVDVKGSTREWTITYVE
jgi:transcription elongation GreA/GreB family factor